MPFPPPAPSRLSEQRPRAWPCWLAWLLHARRAGLRACSGEPPRFGFAPALSVTAWLVLTVYAVERQMFPQLQARWALAGLGAAAVLLALVFPGTPLHAPLRPGCRCTGRWASPPTACSRAAVVHAWLMTRAEKQIRQAADPHARRAAADAGAADLPLRHAPASCCCRPRCWPACSSARRSTATAAAAMGPQDRVLGPGLAGLRVPAARARALRLARPQGACGCSMPARCCCCWPMRARASCSKWC